MPLTCDRLINGHPQLWQDATVHPFLTQCQAGTIQPQQFNTWLVQDYLFVIDCARMAARLMAAAPVEHFDVLLGGLGAIKTELLWFRAKAQERQLNLSTEKQTTCAEYCDLMDGLADAPYAVQAVGFWAIERAYNQSWRDHSPMPSPYTEFADRWGSDGFTEYVQQLADQADEALRSASGEVQQQAKSVFLEVARLEKEFWQMAFCGGVGSGE